MSPVTKVMRALQVIPLAALVLFFVFPVVNMATRYASIENIAQTLTDSSLRKVWWFTLWQALLSTILTVLIALPLTWAVTRFSVPMSRVILGLVTVPFFMPAVVIATGVKAVLPHQSVIGILWAHVVFNVAVIVRIVGARWSLMSDEIEDTAADLGATSWRIFRHVSLPFIKDSLFNASAIVFLFCFSSFGVIAVLGGISRRTIETEVFIQAVQLGDTATAISLSLIQAVVVLTTFVLVTKKTSSTENTIINTSPRHIPHRQRTLVLLATALPVIVVTTPLVGVVIRSLTLDGHITLNGYKWLFDGTTERVGVKIWSTLATSGVFAFTTAVLTSMSAVVIARARQAHGVMTSLTALPLMVSAVTLGLGVIVTFNSGVINWRGERWLIPVLHSVIALPLALRTVVGALDAIPIETTQAASSLGASPWRVWKKVEFPLIWPAVARAMGISGAISLGEFGATSFLSRSDSTTIPIAIAQLLGHPGDTTTQSAFALAALCVVVFTIAFSRS